MLLPDALHGRWASPIPVICIAGRSPVDEAAALLLADLLIKHGLNTTAHGVDVLTSSNLFRLDLDATALVVLSCLDAGSGAHIRNLVRRIRRKAPHVSVLVALWGAEASEAEAVRATSRADLATTGIRGSVAACIGMAVEGKVETHTAPVVLNLLSAS
jgi:hypothetical protein